MTVSKSTRDRVNRGILLATSGAVKAHGDLYVVRGSGDRNYTVSLAQQSCSCPDHRHRGQVCKHLFAAQVVDSREACRRKKTAKPKTGQRHKADAQGLQGIVADMDRLDEVAGRLGV
jgi:hypothetical protein